MTGERLVVVAAFSYLHEAELARTSLEAEGIATLLENENLIRLDWLYMNALGGLRLLVHEEDAARAREILAEPEAAGPASEFPETVAESCPSCGSQSTMALQTRRKITHLLWLLTGVPWISPGRRRRCANCGRRVDEGLPSGG